MKKTELEERLINFTVQIIELTDQLSKSKAGNHLLGQLLRSGTSPALNYAEAQGAESIKDFIHKLQVVLKELRETHVNLKIIDRSKLYRSNSELEKVLKENDELIAIMVKSVQTTKLRLKSKN
ncbi:MAG: four helix bundle protein [Gracilimonas sp.]|nr:four helix bundle protein [Gracilimonas sp.]